MSGLDHIRLRQVEESVSRLEALRDVERPKGGWVKAIRTALRMSMRQLAGRMGVSQPMISHYERAEVEDAITLGTLRRVGDSLGCDLVYALVPRKALSTMIEDQARRVAERRFRKVGESMAIEGQSVDDDELERQIDEHARRLAERGLGSIWEE